MRVYTSACTFYCDAIQNIHARHAQAAPSNVLPPCRPEKSRPKEGTVGLGELWQWALISAILIHSDNGHEQQGLAAHTRHRKPSR